MANKLQKHVFVYFFKQSLINIYYIRDLQENKKKTTKKFIDLSFSFKNILSDIF